MLGYVPHYPVQTIACYLILASGLFAILHVAMVKGFVAGVFCALHCMMGKCVDLWYKPMHVTLFRAKSRRLSRVVLQQNQQYGVHAQLPAALVIR